MERYRELVAEAKKRIREISPQEAAEQVKHSGAKLIDVREADEFQSGHADGAKHLSRGLLELEIEEKIPAADTPIICYCGKGGRGALAADSLQRMGYTNVTSIEGGFQAWKAAGLPTAERG